jgi:hypothetical protein
MPKIEDLPAVPLLALFGGILSILSACHFMEKLAFSLGDYYGVFGVVSTYNVTPSNAIMSLISQSQTIIVALYTTYLMLPIAVVVFTIGALWLFSKSHMKLTAMTLSLASLALILITAFMEYTINYNSYAIYLVSYAGGVISLAAGAYTFASIGKRSAGIRPVRQISIDPQTPYTNIMILSKRLFSKLGGDLKILDMHFDATGLENLSRLLGGNLGRYRSISVLARRDRLGGDFLRQYSDFKNELGNKGIVFELKALSDEDAISQHERMLIDSNTAYKIPPLNIINKKSEHIVSINHKEALTRFDSLWLNSTKLENLRW